VFWNEFGIHLWNWVVCRELTFTSKFYVLQRIWDSLSKLNCLQWIWNLLSKLSCLQRINSRCRIVCFATNLGFVIEVVWSAAKNWIVCSELTFAVELCVLQRIWDSLPKLNCLQWISNSMPKLSCLQRINIRCSIMCPTSNLGLLLKFYGLHRV